MTDFECSTHECAPIAGASFGGLDPVFYLVILLAMLFAIMGLLFLGFRYYTRGRQ